MEFFSTVLLFSLMGLLLIFFIILWSCLLFFPFYVILGALFLIYFRYVCRAEEDCRLFLQVWMEENGMTLLRYHLCWLLPPLGCAEPLDLHWARVVYRVSVEDLEGRTWTAWAVLLGRYVSWTEFIPFRARVRWASAAEGSKGLERSSRPQSKPLWDEWIDG